MKQHFFSHVGISQIWQIRSDMKQNKNEHDQRQTNVNSMENNWINLITFTNTATKMGQNVCDKRCLGFGIMKELYCKIGSGNHRFDIWVFKPAWVPAPKRTRHLLQVHLWGKKKSNVFSACQVEQYSQVYSKLTNQWWKEFGTFTLVLCLKGLYVTIYMY